MKVLVNRKPRRDQPWGGGNLFVIALCDFLTDLGVDVVHSFSEDIDTVFMQDPRYDNLGISINEIYAYKSYKPDVKIIHRVNECDARKNTSDIDSLLRECSKISDHTVFVSGWMRDYHVSKGWDCNNTSVIHNGVDLNHFYQRDKIENGKINIVTHHWSNNRMKGFDIYDEIDRFIGLNDDFTFTYIGRENGTFRNTKVIDPIYGLDLGEELGKYDVYVSGSKHDPGPNHVLESIASNIPTYVISSGGGAVELAGESHTYSSIESLVKILKEKSYINNDYTPRSWQECTREYSSIIL